MAKAKKITSEYLEGLVEQLCKKLEKFLLPDISNSFSCKLTYEDIREEFRFLFGLPKGKTFPTAHKKFMDDIIQKTRQHLMFTGEVNRIQNLLCSMPLDFRVMLEKAQETGDDSLIPFLSLQGTGKVHKLNNSSVSEIPETRKGTVVDWNKHPKPPKSERRNIPTQPQRVHSHLNSSLPKIAPGREGTKIDFAKLTGSNQRPTSKKQKKVFKTTSHTNWKETLDKMTHKELTPV